MDWIVTASLSAVLSAGAALTQKKALATLDTAPFCFALTAAVALLSLPLLSGAAAVPNDAVWVVLAKSVMQAAAFWCVMSALKHADISAALPLLAVTPALTALIAWGAIGERLSGSEWAAMALIVTGAASVERTRAAGRPAPSMSKGLRYVGAALVIYALTSVTDRYLLTQRALHPLSLLFWQHLCAAVIFAGMMLVRRVPFPSFASVPAPLRWMIALTALLTIGYRYTEYDAMRYAPAALVLSVKRTSVIMAAAAGGRLFREPRTGIRVAGALLIVAGGFLFLL
ncbi:MAG: EamA family transporter [Bacteroidetes bacterium]|nr:MAG: EamA family transporter [Bacteroidota bacterium]